MGMRKIACLAAVVIALALALGSCGDNTEGLAGDTAEGLAGDTEKLADEAPNGQSVQTAEQDEQPTLITAEQLVWFKSLPLTPLEVTNEAEEREEEECRLLTLKLEIIASMAGGTVQVVVFDRSTGISSPSWVVVWYRLEGRDGILLSLGDIDSDCPNLQRACLRLDPESLRETIQHIKTPDGQNMDVVPVLVNRHNADRMHGRITPAL